jgi:hypothetical protein
LRQLAAIAHDNLQLQLDNLAGLDTLADGTGASLFELTPVESAARLGLMHLRMWLRGESARLREYDAALRAFVAAHDKLAASCDQLIAKDGEIYAAIVEAGKRAYEGADAAWEGR